MGTLADWAASGAMALTGRADGPPRPAPGSPATFVLRGLAELGLQIPGLLGERAALGGLMRQAPWSCGGAMRILPTADGHLAVSLARTEDVRLLPALIEEPVGADHWATLSAWAASTPTTDAAGRLELLGMPGGAVGTRAGRPPVVSTILGTRDNAGDRPLVLDLTTLWAGPLCADLLSRSGARVLTVRSAGRPDPTRTHSPDFYALLHRGHDEVTLDLTSSEDRARLVDMMGAADLVLESSRPRGLAQMGIDAAEVVRAGTSWVSITARGRDCAAVGFGDDVAACAGLVLPDRDGLIPVGDAIADPLTGVTAAVQAVAALRSDDAVLIDVSMLAAVAAVVGPVPTHTVLRREDRWWVESEDGVHPVADPVARS